MSHHIVDKLVKRDTGSSVLRVSACGSYEGGTSAFERNVTCSKCLQLAQAARVVDAFYHAKPVPRRPK